MARYLLISSAGGLLFFLYVSFIQPNNSYMGMVPLSLDAPWVFLWTLWNAITAMLMPHRLRKPSDCFPMIYSLFVLMTGAVTWGASGVLSIEDGVILLTFLVASIVVYKLFVVGCGYFIKTCFPIPYLANISSYAVPAFVLLMIGVMAGIASGQVGSFGIQDSYARRILGRENFPVGAPVSYIFTMVLNGVAPFIAFFGASKKRYWLLLPAFAFSIYAYWLIGTKAPVLSVALLAYVGYYFRTSSRSRIPMGVLLCIFLLFLVASAEYVITGYSYIADYFVRRAFAVTGQLQGVYANYILHSMDFAEWMIGSSSLKGQAVSLFIGQLYFRNEYTNANTNMLLYTLVQQGVIGWAVALLFIAVVFSILDRLYIVRNAREAMGVGFLYALLLAEQSYSTAFVSSGVGVILVLIIFFRLKKKGFPSLSA
ncbi:hypothetical protein [Castellaniella sp.]|uniref:hypothetical protein n=1 Tax=Castellaniella sp. TaxID=1955812 RepID=UPI003C75A698